MRIQEISVPRYKSFFLSPSCGFAVVPQYESESQVFFEQVAQGGKDGFAHKVENFNHFVFNKLL